MDLYYQLANKGIIHEVLDNEVIIANLDTGIYCSIRGSGVTAWQMSLAGQAFPAILSAFIKKYTLSEAILTAELSAFFAQLVQSELLVSTTQPSITTDKYDFLWFSTYQSPLFESYDDMKALLVLDPIHEVDEQGWPAKIKEKI